MMKVVVNCIYENGFRYLLKKISSFLQYIPSLLYQLDRKIEVYLGYCQKGCRNCYSIKCKARNEERSI